MSSKQCNPIKPLTEWEILQGSIVAARTTGVWGFRAVRQRANSLTGARSPAPSSSAVLEGQNPAELACTY